MARLNHKQFEKCVLVGHFPAESRQTIIEKMEECARLCEACGLEMVDSFVVRNHTIVAGSYIGKGKIREIREFNQNHDIRFTIFYNELTATQIRNLEKGVNTPVIDRTSLILMIFNERAKTKEARLQVEIAQLQYALPRLVGSSIYLGRQGGGSSAKNKGLGETKLELNRRKIEADIANKKKELGKVSQQRQIQRHRRTRSALKKVALVGYTNAGKSSLMNAFLNLSEAQEEKQVFQEDMLFSTLETSTRFIQTSDCPPFLLSDTVGFVSDLPHSLVETFQSTLQEVCEADCLLHVVDATSENLQMQQETTLKTLQEIGAGSIPMITVYNKIDTLQPEQIPLPAELCVSAKTGVGLSVLLQQLSRQLYPTHKRCTLLIPYEQSNLAYQLKNEQLVYSMIQQDCGFLVEAFLSDSLAHELCAYVIHEFLV